MSRVRTFQPSVPLGQPSHARLTIRIAPLAVLLEAVALLNIALAPPAFNRTLANLLLVPAVVLLTGAAWLWPQSTGFWRLFTHFCLSIGALILLPAVLLMLQFTAYLPSLGLIAVGVAMLGHAIAILRTPPWAAAHPWMRALQAVAIGLIVLSVVLRAIQMFG